ncbi:hypothetical protein Tco_1118664, partial [Tanacetum coccineum]
MHRGQMRCTAILNIISGVMVDDLVSKIAFLVTRDFLKVQRKKPYGNILISRGSEMCSRSPSSGTHNGSDAPSSNKNNGKKLVIGDILGISLGSPFFIALIDLVLILFCRKGKRDEHVTRPSTVHPPFSSEKVNAEN